MINLKRKRNWNEHKLKDFDKCKGVYLEDDLSPGDQIKKKEARAIYSYPRSKGNDGKTLCMNLVIDNIKYSSNNQLPHNMTMNNAKMVEVQDGLALQGLHAIFSNQCDFVYERRIHTSSEQAPRYKRAKVGRKIHVARKIMETDNVFEDMWISKRI